MKEGSQIGGVAELRIHNVFRFERLVVVYPIEGHGSLASCFTKVGTALVLGMIATRVLRRQSLRLRLRLYFQELFRARLIHHTFCKLINCGMLRVQMRHFEIMRLRIEESSGRGRHATCIIQESISILPWQRMGCQHPLYW